MSLEIKQFSLSEVIPSIPIITVAGLAWGDEGKGKVAAALEGWYDVVAAANGGGNAGHNVIVHEGTPKEVKLHFHELPGASVSGATTYISSGRVVHIGKLSQEIELLQLHTSKNVEIVLSAQTQVVLQKMQQKLDADIEGSLACNGGTNVGTTKKGIGPSYALKALRLGLNVGQLLYETDEHIRKKVHAISEIFSGVDENSVFEEYMIEKQKLQELISQGIIRIDETNTFIADIVSKKVGKVIVECSQSAMLSISGNAYPNCTSSECAFNGIAPNLGIETPGFKIGVIKAIPSKVGNGTFPTKFEINGVKSDIIAAYRAKAGEFGATTGRPRDVGFFDAVQLRYIFKTGNKPDVLWINMVDLLSFLYSNGIKNKVATGYYAQHKFTGEVSIFTDTVPPDIFEIKEVLFEEAPDVISELDYRAYVEYIRKVLGFNGPIVIGIGPGSRDNILFK